MQKKTKLGILSVFLTVDGEANRWAPGAWSVFVRTRGCEVGCHWCDTKYSWSFKGGKEFTPHELAAAVYDESQDCTKVTITGGEPLEQDWIVLASFIALLLRNHFDVSVETSGTQNTLDFRRLIQSECMIGSYGNGDLSFVVDYKLQGSKFKGEMDIENHFSNLPAGDVVKFVIDTQDDFDEACLIADRLYGAGNFEASMYFSPSHGRCDPATLFEMMKDTNLPSLGVGLNVQSHKYIWPWDSRDEEDGGLDFTKRSMGRKKYLESTREEGNG